MAKKKETGEPKEETPKANPVKAELPVDGDEQPETKEVEVSVSVGLGEPEKRVKQKLVSKKVFEPMQGVFRTVWVKED